MKKDTLLYSFKSLEDRGDILPEPVLRVFDVEMTWYRPTPKYL